MNQEQLAHVLRTAAKIAGDPRILVIGSQAVLVAIGINWEGRREVLGVEMANRESRSSWRDFLLA